MEDNVRYISDKDDNRIDVINNGDKILRKKSCEFLENTVEFNKGKRFIKCFVNENVLGNELTGVELSILTFLRNFISYRTAILAHDNGKILTDKNIADYFDTSERSVRRVISSLVEKEVLYKDKVGHKKYYIMNPYIYTLGKRVDKSLVELFKDSKWAK